MVFSRDMLHGYVCCLSIHKYGCGAFGAGSILVESILVDGEAASIAMRPTPTEGHTPTEGTLTKTLPIAAGVLFHFLKYEKEYIRMQWTELDVLHT